MHRVALVSLVVALAGSAFAQSAVDLMPTYTQGAVTKYKTVTKMPVRGTEAEIIATATRTVGETNEGETKIATVFSDVSILVGGSPMGEELAGYDATHGPAGEVVTVSGGPQELDAVRLYLAMNLVVPTLPVEPGAEFETVVEAFADAGLPKLQIKGQYVGTEEVDGVTLHKLTATTTEQGDANGLKVEGTYWLDATNQLIRADVKFSNLYIFEIGESVSGTIELRKTE